MNTIVNNANSLVMNYDISKSQNAVQIFDHPEFGKIRIVTINDEPWLVGKDVAAALGYGDTDQALRKHVDNEDKLTRQFDGSGQNRNMTIINESGLYSLVMSSKLPDTKKFKHWMMDELIPSIKKKSYEKKSNKNAENKPESAIQVFSNPEFGQMRTVTIDGEIWMVGKDVALALGYSNTKDALLRHVDVEDKRGSRIPTTSGIQEMTIINESGLYSLVMSSKLPDAKKFKRWVTSEVLPSIHKHGAYMTPDTIEKILYNPDFIIRLASDLKEEREKNKRLSSTVASQQQELEDIRPKATYYDMVLNCKDLVPISVIAKDYGMSAFKMNQLLKENGVQYKQGNIWLLHQKYADCEYTGTKTYIYEGNSGQHSKVHTFWTQKGRLFIYEMLKEQGILPMIERRR